MKRHFRLGGLFALTILAIFLFGPRPASSGWRNFSTGTPLVATIVYQAIEDREGHHWFCTQSGLHRFDGISWTSFTEADGLPSTAIVDALEDRNGVIWVAGLGNGIGRYDGTQWQIQDTTDGLGFGPVYSLAMDSSGAVWAATNGGASRNDGDHWTTFATGVGDPLIKLLLADRSGGMWTASTYLTGVNHFDGVSWQTYTSANGLGSDGVSCLAQDPSGTMWFGSIQDGATSFDGTVWQRHTTANGLPSNYVWKLLADSQGRVWAGTGSGIGRFEFGAWRSYGEADGLGANASVYALLEARNGDIWAATSRGVSRFDGRAWKTYGATDGLGSYGGNRLLEDRSSAIWALTASAANRFDGVQWQRFGQTDGLEANEIFDLLLDPADQIWAATSSGLSRFDGRTWATIDTTDGLGSNYVTKLLMTRTGALWVGTENGASRLIGEAWENFTSANGLGSGGVNDLIEARDGSIWATTNAGICRFDGSGWTNYLAAPTPWGNFARGLREDRFDNIWTVLGTAWPARFDGISWRVFTNKDGPFADSAGAGSYVNAINIDTTGTIWVGTNRGAARFDETNWTTYTVQEGLASDYIFGFLNGPGGLWAGTYDGVSRFDGTTWTSYGTRDGLSEPSSLPLAVDRSNGVWCASRGNGGVDRFDGRFWRGFSSPGELGIRTVRDIVESASGEMWFGGDGVFRHSRDRVAPMASILNPPAIISANSVPTLSWAAAYREDESIWFSHSLDGSTPTDWDLRTTRSAELLADGPHELRVWARDASGNVSANPAKCRFDIDATPPLPNIASPSYREVVHDSITIVGGTADSRFFASEVLVRPADEPTWEGPRVVQLSHSTSAVQANGVLARLNTKSSALAGDGEYDVRVSVTDALGLIGSAVQRIIIDNDAPSASQTSPAAIDVSQGGDVFTTRREAHLYIPPNALPVAGVVTLENAVDSLAFLPPLANLGGPAYRIAWAGGSLRSLAALDFELPDSLRNLPLSVWRQVGQEWEFIGGTFDRSTSRISVPVSIPGIYASVIGATSVTGTRSLAFLGLTPRVLSASGGTAHFPGRVAIQFSLVDAGTASLRIYNRAGRLVRRVIEDESLAGGANTVWWDGRDSEGQVTEPGIYILSLSAKGQTVQSTLAVVP